MVIAKYADHLPLYRAGSRSAGRQGVELDRSTLADWSGRAAFEAAAWSTSAIVSTS